MPMAIRPKHQLNRDEVPDATLCEQPGGSRRSEWHPITEIATFDYVGLSNPPQLSREDRAAAAAAALAARRRRAEIKAQVAIGSIGVNDVLELADTNPSLAKMKVSDLLSSLPRIGPVRAAAIMKQLEIAPSRRLRGLGERQRRALTEHFEGM